MHVLSHTTEAGDRTDETRCWTVATSLCVMVHLGCIVWQIRANSPTRNEVAHVPAGLVNLQSGEFDLYRVNPPLSRLIQALPVWMAGAKTERLFHLPRQRGIRGEWTAARIFAEDNLSNYTDLIVYARLPGLLWTLIGILILRRWCRELYGVFQARLATIIWCFSPNILAHAALATPDFPCAVSVMAAGFVFSRYLGKPAATNAFHTGLVLGIAQLTKFSALVLYPSGAVIIIAALLTGRGRLRLLPWRSLLGHSGVVVGVSLCVINLGYLAEGSLTRLDAFDFESKRLSFNDQGLRRSIFSDSFVGGFPVPLPANYVRGLDLQQADFEGDLKSFLRGEHCVGGWWYFYLYAMLIKIPTGMLILGAFVILASCRRLTQSVENLAVWVPCMALIAVASCKTGYTMHFRYILPALPLAIVGLARIGSVSSVAARRTVLVLIIWSVLSSLFVAPQWLAYFNETAGGPRNGASHLIDSNIDWGQDLFRLRDWIQDHPEARPLYVSYINYVPRDIVPLGSTLDVPSEISKLKTGWYIIDHQTIHEMGHKYFLQLIPVDRAGYSINVYYISSADVERLRHWTRASAH